MMVRMNFYGGGIMKMSAAAKNALLLGTVCSIAYLSVYVARDILSATTPMITRSGDFNTEQIGLLSSVYFTVYAIGQLINGVIGDKIKARYMISFGLILASFGFFLLPQLTHLPGYAYFAYGSAGFFMAMIYGPMTKVVSENAEPLYASRCSVAYTLASCLGSPVAGVLASMMTWPWAFRSSSFLLIFMGLFTFISFFLMERKGIIRYGRFKPQAGTTGSVKVLFQRKIVKFTFVSILTGVIRTSVVFWMPTYISRHLGFVPETATLIFSVASFAFPFSALLAMFLYQRTKRNLDMSVLVGFISSTVFFLLVFFVKQPLVNVACLALAIFCNNIASNLMWSYYCPSLYDTGMVSTATGFLNACSYLAAAVSSALFSNAADTIGWGALVLIWAGLMGLGILVALPWKRK